MPVSKYSKKYTLKEFNLEDEFEKDKKAMGLEDDDEDAADRMSKNIGARALKDAEDLKAIPTTKDLAAFYKNEKGYKYYIKDNKWRGIIVKNNKEFDVMKYPSTVEKLNKEFGTNIKSTKTSQSSSSKKSSSKKMSPDAFISKFGPIVKKASPGSGVFPSVTLAQAILETGWGKSTIGDANNMFGIKAKGSKTPYWKGESETTQTIEYIKGQKGSYNLAFRKYASLEDSIKDHNLFLQKSRYSKAVQAKTPEEQAKEIKAAGYATDPKYADKLISLIKKYDLKKFDDDMIKEKEGSRALSERKIISEKNLRYLMKMLIKENIDDRKPKTKEEGSKFRKWVNDNIPKSDISDLFAFSSDKKLDLEGSIDNSHFNTAWKEFGEEYLEDSTTANPDDVPGESQTSDYSKGYPDSKDNAAVMNKDEKFRYYVKDIGGKKYWVGITVASGKEHVFKGETKGNLKGVDALNKYFGTDFTAATEPEDTREFDFYPSGKPDKMQPAGRGVPEPYFKFRKGDRNDTNMEIFGMTAGGDIYYTSNTDPDIGKDEKGRFKFVKLNESRSIKKVLINESGTKARIVLENLSAMKKFDLTKEFMKDLDALGLSDEQAPGVVQAKGVADAKVDSMAPATAKSKPAKGKGEKGAADPSIHTFLDEASLPIRFEQLDMSAGASDAEALLSDMSGFSEYDAVGRKKINDRVVKVSIERYGNGKAAFYVGGQPVDISKSENLWTKKAWSGHTFGAMVTETNPCYSIIKKIPTSGIGYPWPALLLNRNNIENDLEGSIGKTVLMPFSREEIEARSDLSLEDGVFSLEGQSKKNGGLGRDMNLKKFKDIARPNSISGAHMNVYSGGKLIGGNLGGKVKKVSVAPYHSVFFILVKVLSNDVPVA
jgi:flagellum-specific peptidoglycan hydrolase FlgJ